MSPRAPRLLQLRHRLPGRSINKTAFRLAVLGLALALGLIGWFSLHRPQAPTKPIGLFTSLPLVWSEEPGIGGELRGDQAPHWAKTALARQGAVVPLDTLTPAPRSLSGLSRLVIAQPRALSPTENVALDAWVRGGGQLLLLADPAWTEESSYPIGDPRRPQAAAMLSPILARWGLQLQFDAAQPLEQHDRKVMGFTIPTVLAGTFVTRGQANCRLWGEGLAVTCAIGKGRVFALADAAVLEREDPDGRRARAFENLLDSAFVGN